MIEKDTARFQNPLHNLEILRQVFQADVLEHANAGNLVEQFVNFLQLAVVLQLHCTGLVQSGSLNPELCHLRLFPAYRNSLSEDAVLAGGVQDEASPPASDVQELLTRLQPQLLAD